LGKVLSSWYKSNQIINLMAVKLRKSLIRISKFSIYAIIFCQSLSLVLANDNAQQLSEVDFSRISPRTTTLINLIYATERQGAIILGNSSMELSGISNPANDQYPKL
jgi:hypothetical protein